MHINSFIPRIPKPIATPINAFSDVGMSKTLSLPNFSTKPLVDPNILLDH